MQLRDRVCALCTRVLYPALRHKKGEEDEPRVLVCGAQDPHSTAQSLGDVVLQSPPWLWPMRSLRRHWRIHVSLTLSQDKDRTRAEERQLFLVLFFFAVIF